MLPNNSDIERSVQANGLRGSNAHPEESLLKPDIPAVEWESGLMRQREVFCSSSKVCLRPKADVQRPRLSAEKRTFPSPPAPILAQSC
jgi:hypothetical protein